MKELYEIYHELQSFLERPNDLQIEKLIEYLGKFIDLSFDLREVDGLSKSIEILNSINKTSFSKRQKIIANYYQANALCDLFDLHNQTHKESKPFWEWEPEQLKKAISYLRSAILEDEFANMEDIIKCNILTNLANTFDKVGRFIEAIEYWNEAIDIDPNFGMALGNRGIGLIQYARNLYDPGHQGVFIRSARKDLLSAINLLNADKKVDYQALNCFKVHFERVNKIIPEPKDYTCLTKTFRMGESQEEEDYRKWCLGNNLFLNPLNDLGYYSIAAGDIITTPNIVTSIDVGPKYQGFFNQIKQEFTSARYLYYEGITFHNNHFSDREVLLYNTLDYPAYGISIEKVKIAFRISYSLFDKIAYFLNEYFNLGIDKNHVYFKNIWFDNKKKIRDEINAKMNMPLRAIYWLSKDFFDSQNNHTNLDLLDPDSKSLYEIRNHLEHKYLKIHIYPIRLPTNDIEKGLFDDLAYSLTRQEFERKTLRLLQSTRNAIIYLSLAIHIEELERQKKSDANRFILPVPYKKWEDEWKF